VKTITLATRASKLALWQSEHIKAVLEEQNPGLVVELKEIVTMGDKILDKSLSKIGGKGLFLKELEEAMLRGEAQIAVHSLKDVPTVMPEGFVLAAISEREDPRDAMLSQNYPDIASLPRGAVVGTSSLRRRMQIKELRSDLEIKDLRGNVNTRIQKLKDGEFDAIILAAAGINRLSLLDEVRYVYPISIDEMIPSMGQGALGIETINDPEIIAMIARLNDDETMMETTIERAFVDTLEGGCQVPIGVNANLLEDGTISVKATLGLPDGSEVMKDARVIPQKEYKTFGKALAEEFIAQGAKDLLRRAEEMMVERV
jgi:hydroxymethylbilane synthase